MREHDYTSGKQGWGHALHMIRMEEGETPVTFWQRLCGKKPERYNYLTCMGHGYNVNEGDVLLISMQSGNVARFKIIDLDHMHDPRDMFRVNRADFIGYVEPQADRVAA